MNASSERRTDRPLLPRPGKVVHDQIHVYHIGRRCWLCVFPLFECVFVCRGSGNLQVKQMVGMLYKIAIDKL